MSFFNLFQKQKESETPKRAAEDSGDSPLEVSLIFACRTGNLEEVSKLLRSGANPNLPIPSAFGSKTPFYYAWGKPQVMLLLLEHGADPNIRAAGKGTPLEVACAEGDHETVRLLVSHGASINTRDDDGWTPLMFACGGNPDAKIAELLINLGADINACNKKGWSVLMNAAEYGDQLTVAALLRAGARPNAVDKDGNSPFRLAVHGGHTKAASLIQAAGGK